MTTDPPSFYTLAPDGVRLAVGFTPRGGGDRLDGVVQGGARWRSASPPRPTRARPTPR